MVLKMLCTALASTTGNVMCKTILTCIVVGDPKGNIHYTVKTTVDIVKDWRGHLPPMLAWDDGDPPATDLNVARLRAKVYGALYVVLRPALFVALEKARESPTSNAQSTELSDLAYQCVEAAIQSTIAFDRVGAPPDSPYNDYISTRTGRLIVTNIFGTLHA